MANSSSQNFRILAKIIFWTMVVFIPAIAGYAFYSSDVTVMASFWDYLSGLSNSPPVADFSIENPITNRTSGDEIIFNASASRDDGRITKYHWFIQKDNEKMRSETTEGTVLKKKLEYGSYTVVLTVEDDKRITSSGKEQRFFVSPKPPEPRKFTPDIEVFGSNGYKKLVQDELAKVDASSASVQVSGKPAGEYVRYFLDKLIEGEEYNASRGNVSQDTLYLPKTMISASNLVHAARHNEQAADGFIQQVVNEFVEIYGRERVREDQRIKDKMLYRIEKDAVEKQIAWEQAALNLTQEEAQRRFRAYMETYEHWDSEQFALDFPKK